jgi:uncharacterized membrane protein (UPF0127 family)
MGEGNDRNRRVLASQLFAMLLSFNSASAFCSGYIELSAAIYRIQAEIADTVNARDKGLSLRHYLGTSQGMLFVFPLAKRHCMWMHDTLIPLSAAYIDAHGTIANIEEMEPLSEGDHCASRDVPYVLEMNQGWFGQRHIVPGTKIPELDAGRAQ